MSFSEEEESLLRQLQEDIKTLEKAVYSQGVKTTSSNTESLSKIRKAGEFGISEGVETHIEGGGPEGGIIYQNIQVKNDLVYSILNSKDLSVKIDVTFNQFCDDFLAGTQSAEEKIAI